MPGRPARFEEIPPERVRELLCEEGWPPHAAEEMVSAYARLTALPADTTTAVQEITGAPARTFRQWVADHLDAFR
ncbi:hypothetical protein ACQEU5_19365 [Marinactinospora thermotolerans]|uniref:hypothetical protein n=1 Tax=Marinactinospora thermotolerans TaxID=531310 RepID=UPI003D8CA888